MFLCVLLSLFPPPHPPRPPPPPDVGSQLFGSDEEEVGVDSGVCDSDKVDSEAAAPADTNSNQVLDLLKNAHHLFTYILKILFQICASCDEHI